MQDCEVNAWNLVSGCCVVFARGECAGTAGCAVPDRAGACLPPHFNTGNAKTHGGARRKQSCASREAADSADAMSWVEREFGVTYTYTGMHALLNRSQGRERQDEENHPSSRRPGRELFDHSV